jgi:hypothetical protein
VQAAGFTPTTRLAFSPDGTFGTFEGDLPNGYYLERERVKAEEFLSEHFKTFLEATTVKIQECAPPPASRPPPPDPPAPSPPAPSPPPSEPADSAAEARARRRPLNPQPLTLRP